MISREEIYSMYDTHMPKICEPYEGFLSLVAESLPNNCESVLELGIGTGNLAAKVRNKLPNTQIVGLDLDERAMEIAKRKVSEINCVKYDFFKGNIPLGNDYIISSLAMHHLPTALRTSKLSQIARRCKRGFVNFDIMLSPGRSRDEVIEQLLEDIKENITNNELVEGIEREIRENDNYMPFEEQKRLFEDMGMIFKTLGSKDPYFVYQIQRK